MLVRHACNVQICVHSYSLFYCVYIIHTSCIYAVGTLLEQRDSKEWLQHISEEHMVRNSCHFHFNHYTHSLSLTLTSSPPPSVVILAYDITNEETLEKTRLGGHHYLFSKSSQWIYICYLRSWLREAREFCTSDFKVFLVSTKKDLVVSIYKCSRMLCYYYTV